MREIKTFSVAAVSGINKTGWLQLRVPLKRWQQDQSRGKLSS
jgi:hypothetical protein